MSKSFARQPLEPGCIQEFEQRVIQLEALVKEMRHELETLKARVTEEDMHTLRKMQAYQRLADSMLGMKEIA